MLVKKVSDFGGVLSTALTNLRSAPTHAAATAGGYVPLLCPVLLSGPYLDVRGRVSSQQPQRALADVPDGVSDPESIRGLPSVLQGLPHVAEVLRRTMGFE